jgi:hypothetical protein
MVFVKFWLPWMLRLVLLFFVRCVHDETAVTIAPVLLSMFCDFGFPRALQSDNGPSLVSDIMISMANIFDISKRTVAAYNPQANGLAENGVKLSKKLIRQLSGGRLKRCGIGMFALLSLV